MSSKSAPPDDLYILKGKDLENFGFARARDLAYDAVQDLWQRRKAEGWTQIKLANNLNRDTGWLSKKLQGPGNWTFRTFGALVQGLEGDLQIKVHAAEDPLPIPHNYHAYVEYGMEPDIDEASSVEDEAPSVEGKVVLAEKGPLLNRHTLIDDETQQIIDTSRRDDEMTHSSSNEVKVTLLEPVNA